MHEEFELAGSASSVEQLEYASLQLARRQGFERFRLSVETPAGPRTRNPFQTADAITRYETHNLPPELVGSWADLCVLDPIVKRHRQSLAPIAWGRAEYVDAGALERWTLQARFGFAKGLIASCPRSDGSIVFFEMAKSDSAGWSVANMRTDLALGALFAACAADAAHTLLPSAALASDARGKDRSGLTPREIECLRWSSVGKTYAEIAGILNVSRPTVDKHLTSIRGKLNCVSTPQAIAIFFRLGVLRDFPAFR